MIAEDLLQLWVKKGAAERDGGPRNMYKVHGWQSSSLLLLLTVIVDGGGGSGGDGGG